MDTAFIGDIHGCADALEDLLLTIEGSTDRLVFLGDYVDRGPNSKDVLARLIELEARAGQEVVFLAGNHDRMLLKALNDDDDALTDLLRMGGATTIRSYVEPPYRDVLSQLRKSFPDSHRDFLCRLSTYWSDGEVSAVHDARDLPGSVGFVVAGHAAQTSLLPNITSERALIDTGCGTIRGGRLTCFRWPSKEWVQSSIPGI